MIYLLCIKESYYREGYFRIERYECLKELEKARIYAMRDARVKCWVA